MTTRREFARALARLDISDEERAVAFLWFYRQTQQFEERTAASLASDLHEEAFSKPNVTRLRKSLVRSKFTTKGLQAGTFRINLRQLEALDQKFASLAKPIVRPDDHIIPYEWVKGTRVYLERLVDQINGAYQYGFYDCSAVLCRRLMESLVIEIYIKQQRHSEIQKNGFFVGLEELINYICSDPKIPLARNSSKTMKGVKEVGDNAAHDRTYITEPQDLDDLTTKFRKLISELLGIAKIR